MNPHLSRLLVSAAVAIAALGAAVLIATPLGPAVEGAARDCAKRAQHPACTGAAVAPLTTVK